MPVVNGEMFASLEEQLVDPLNFNVLILDKLGVNYIGFMSKIEVLHNYIEDKIKDGTRIHIHEFDNKSVDLIIDKAKKLDIDVIYDKNKVFTKKQILNHNANDFKIVDNFEDLTDELEIFLVGRKIAWLFSNPIWNMTMFMRYHSRPGLCVDTFNLMAVAKSKYKYSGRQAERVRYLTNRIAQIEYSKDTLNSLLQKKRRTARYGVNQDYSFEINHELSNYYFLITGGLDIMARIINDVFNLGITNFNAIALEKDDFQKTILARRPALANTLKVKKNIDWMRWMKERRNYVAHEAGISHTPLLKEKKKLMSEEEIEELVDKEVDWSFFKANLPDANYKNMRTVSAEKIRLANNYEEVSKDMMFIRSKDGTKLFHPLTDIDYDYKRLVEIISKVEIRLKTARH